MTTRQYPARRVVDKPRARVPEGLEAGDVALFVVEGTGEEIFATIFDDEGALNFRYDENNRHPQTIIEHEGRRAIVDADMEPLILALWRLGFETTASCSDFGHATGKVGLYVQFVTIEQAVRFASLCEGLPMIMMLSHGSAAPRGWPRERIIRCTAPQDIADRQWYPHGSAGICFPPGVVTAAMLAKWLPAALTAKGERID